MATNTHHHHEVKDFSNAFLIGIVLNLLFVIAEIIFGIKSDSLALISDAGHNLSDVLALVTALVAILLGKRKPTKKFTYGFKKTSILAALFNAVILLIAIGGITWEAIRRLIHPVSISSNTVIIVAAIGIFINGVTALLFVSGKKEDLNIRGAFLHMFADCLMSAGVVFAGVLIKYTGMKIIDPIVSLIIAIVIFYGTWSLLKESLSMSIDSVPSHININEVIDFLKSYKEIQNVHDIHIWNMSTSEVALTAHVVKPDNRENDNLIKKILKDLKEKFNITHVTIQFENNKDFCQYKDICKLNN